MIALKDLTRYLNSVKSQGNIYLPCVLSFSSESDLTHAALQHCAPLGGPLLPGYATPPLFFQSLRPNFPRRTPISSVQNRGPFCSVW